MTSAWSRLLPAALAAAACLSLLAAPSRAQPQCLVNSSRTDCGYLGTGQSECEANGCCWSPVSPNPLNLPWCFLPGAPVCAAAGPRRDCGYVGITQAQCLAQNCCWNEAPNQPWCFYRSPPPASYVLESVQVTQAGITGTLVVNSTGALSPFGRYISPLSLQITYVDPNQVRIYIADPSDARWEIPQEWLPTPTPQPGLTPAALNYAVKYTQSPFSVQVVRNSDGVVMFDSSTGPLVFADQFLQLVTSVADDPNVYGLGEHRDPLRLDSDDHTYTFWSHDAPTPVDMNLYGSHPFYLEVRPGGASHGVFFRNSNGMDVVLDSGQLTYRAIGGVMDFFVFAGPGPKDVIQQYHSNIGRPHMPPLWALGWHQCRWGYPDLAWVEQVVANYTANQIPLECIWNDIDYMDQYKDFTTDPVNYPTAGMASFAAKLHADGQRYVVIVDPGIHNLSGYAPYDDGEASNAFIKQADGVTDFVGSVWPGSTVYPDFTQAAVRESYWPKQIASFLNQVPVDGLWIDMNEPSNFNNGPSTTSSKYNSPPYAINNLGNQSPLDVKTLGMDCVQFPDGPAGPNGTAHYNVHNLYGFTEAIATRAALEAYYSRRSFVLARSTFAGSGSHTAKWTGDNFSDFPSMASSVIQIMNLNMFGLTLSGADICGFNEAATEEICARWTALGAFYPFARNHNAIGEPDQEPYRWPLVAAVARQVLAARYSLLPYYYTLFAQAAQAGGTVARPLFFEFPADGQLYGLDTQYMMGPALMVAPVLHQGATSVPVYFPQARWFGFWDAVELQGVGGTSVTVDAPLDFIPVFVRGGSVLPMQVPANNTANQRNNPLRLVVVPDANGQAQGSIYADDGDTLDWAAESLWASFDYADFALKSAVAQSGYLGLPPVETVFFWGLDAEPSSVLVNGAALPAGQLDFNATSLVLAVSGLSLSVAEPFVVALAFGAGVADA